MPLQKGYACLKGRPIGNRIASSRKPHYQVHISANGVHYRIAINVQSSDVVLALGAATPGTLSEIALALKADKPVVLVGASDHAKRFLAAVGNGRVHVAADARDAIALIKRLLPTA